MSTITSTITVQNKKYEYTLHKKKDGLVRVVCKDARIDQDFLSEDVTGLILDIPELIVAERTNIAKQSDILRFRVSSIDKKRIEQKAVKSGFASVSDYLRHLALK